MYPIPDLTLYRTITPFFKYFCCLLLFTQAHSQNIQINGKADASYAGKVIELFSSTDYVTNFRLKESQDTIDKDGYFELSVYSDLVQPLTLKVENVIARLYVQPDYVYGITIPELDQDKNINSDVELEVNIGIVGTDSTELNVLIFDYQNQYNQLFIPGNDRFLSRPQLFRRADSLQKMCDLRYSKISSPYFHNYVTYSIASINTSLSRGEDYLMKKYLIGKPIQYSHFEYMQFFNAATRGYLERISSGRKGQTLYNIINKGDYRALQNFVQLEKEIPSDSLRELIIIRNLWDDYFKGDFSKEAIAAIISQISTQSKNKEHKKITSSMLSYFNKMQVGSKAPEFSALDRAGKIVSLSAFKGRWIYLNFFSSKNVESMKEMPKIATMKKKFGEKLIFLSICLDDSVAAYKAYLKANPKFDWPIWYNYDKSIPRTAKEAYFVTGTENYFLINNFGYLAQSPALSPSKGIEYKLNVIFKVRQRTTKTGIR